jgi:predicted HicB family RNase H-like nuclease
MNVMSYKGYLARIEYSDEDACFIGHLAGIQDVIGFHGDSVAELKQAFNEAVDDYLATCKKLNRAAQKPYSGKMMLRIDPSIHAKAAMLAQAQGVSLNAWAQAALNQAIAAH